MLDSSTGLKSTSSSFTPSPRDASGATHGCDESAEITGALAAATPAGEADACVPEGSSSGARFSAPSASMREERAGSRGTSRRIVRLITT